MKIGFYTYSYLDRLDMPIGPTLEAIAAAGYDAVDLSATRRRDLDPALFPVEDRREILRLTAALGLEIAALVTHLPLVNSLWDGRPLNLLGACDLAAELGCPLVTVHAGSEKGTDWSPEEAWQRAVAHLREVAEYGAARGVTVAVDALFPNYLAESPARVKALVEAVDHPRFAHNFDPCYVAICGFDMEAAIQLLAPHIVHVHVKDHHGRYPDFRHDIPGEGELDHGLWVRALTETGFTGTAAIETFTDHPFEEACRKGFETLQAAVAAVEDGERPSQ
jgi:sugar phosphate isomerase/epimerase